MITINKALSLMGQGVALATANLTIHDRDADVDANVAALTINGLPSRRWRLIVTISSTPLVGTGPPLVVTVDTGVAATSITLPATKTYRRVKDIEGRTGGNLLCAVSLQWFNGAGVWVNYADTRNDPDSVTAYSAPAAVKAGLKIGINAHLFSAALPAESWRPALDVAAALGATWVRFSVPWGYIETARGVRDANMVAMVDMFMADAAARGLKVLAITAGAAPGWSTTTKSTAAVTYTPRGWGGAPNYPAVLPAWSFSNSFVSNALPPDDWADFTNHISWFVGRYAGGGLAGAGGTVLGAVECMNEPFAGSQLNLTRDSGTKTTWDGNSAAILAAWQSHLYTATKAAAGGSGVTVIGLVSAHNDWTLLQNLYNTGAFKGNYDAISVHPYPVTFDTPASQHYDPRFPFGDETTEWHHHPASLGYFIDVMDANNDPAPVWVTEFGASSGDIAKSALNVSPQEQADHVDYMWRLLSRYQRVEAIFMHTIEDVGSTYMTASPYVWNNFGVVKVDRVTRKPAFAAVQNVITQIKAGTA